MLLDLIFFFKILDGFDFFVFYECMDWCLYKDKNFYKLLMLNLNISELGIKICNKRKNIFVFLK